MLQRLDHAGNQPAIGANLKRRSWLPGKQAVRAGTRAADLCLPTSLQKERPPSRSRVRQRGHHPPSPLPAPKRSPAIALRDKARNVSHRVILRTMRDPAVKLTEAVPSKRRVQPREFSGSRGVPFVLAITGRRPHWSKFLAPESLGPADMSRSR